MAIRTPTGNQGLSAQGRWRRVQWGGLKRSTFNVQTLERFGAAIDNEAARQVSNLRPR